MKQTEHYKLNKFQLADSPPDITAIDKNWETIDKELKAHQDSLDAQNKTIIEHLESDVESHVVSERVRGENEPTYGLI